MDFSHLETLNAAGKTSRLNLDELGDGIYVEMRIADETNAPYYNELLRIGAERAEKTVKRGKQKVDPKILEYNRKVDAELFPLFVICGWGGIKTSDGVDVPWSTEACTAFVAQLVKSCPRVFDEIRAHANTHGNFIDYGPEPDTKNLVEN